MNSEHSGAPLRDIDERCLVGETRPIRGGGHQCATVRAHTTYVRVRALMNVNVVFVCAVLPAQLDLNPLSGPIRWRARHGKGERLTRDVLDT